MLNRKLEKLVVTFDTKFVADMRAMIFHSTHADEQIVRDLFARLVLSK